VWKKLAEGLDVRPRFQAGKKIIHWLNFTWVVGYGLLPFEQRKGDREAGALPVFGVLVRAAIMQMICVCTRTFHVRICTRHKFFKGRLGLYGLVASIYVSMYLYNDPHCLTLYFLTASMFGEL
jgi:hypothetical protein